MIVIDVDSHFEPADPVGPLGEFADRIPSRVELMAHFVAGDLYGQVPVEQRPEPETLLPEPLRRHVTQPAEQSPTRSSPGAADGADRVAWLDRVGIDYEFVAPGGYAELCGFIHDAEARRTAVRLVNDQVADFAAGHTDRISPVTILDFTDLDWAVAELERMHARGSRGFYIKAEPVGGVSPAHPQWDPLWETATRLGMMAMLHIGHAPARFDAGWVNAGTELPGGSGMAGFLRFANSQIHQAGQVFLAAMVFGGAFARHPDLTVLLAEQGVAWLPALAKRFTYLTSRELGSTEKMLGSWPFELSGAEFLYRNVRATPLPGAGDDGVDEIASLGEMIVFSSDYPHLEGSDDPIRLYGDRLGHLDDDQRRSFFGESVLRRFAAMGVQLGGDRLTAAS